MGSKSEALAKQFEAKADEALATLQRLNETEWKLVTEAENADEHYDSIRRTVGHN